EFNKAPERLAAGTPISVSDPGSPFGKAMRQLAACVEKLEALPADPSSFGAAELKAPAPVTGASDPRELELLRSSLEALRQQLNLMQMDPAELASPRFRE